MKSNAPLAGIKIVELSTVVTAALATTILCEQGAEAIKIEPLGIGDTLRHLGTSYKGVSAMFANCNRGKRSIALNLKTDAGVAIAQKLAAEADILISNYRPGVLQKLGLSSEALREINPRLIYMAISGFGTSGPLMHAPAYDHVIQALTGYAAMQGLSDADGPDSEQPFDLIRTFVCDEATAYTSAQAVTSALYQRSNTGQGQHIDVSMMDSALYFLWPAGMADQTYLEDDTVKKPPMKATYRIYKTNDGSFCMAPFNDAHWHGLFRATNNEEMIDDPMFSNMLGRAANMYALIDKFIGAFTHLSTDEAIALLKELDIPAAKCETPESVLQHPQIKASNSVHKQHHETLGSLNSPANPARFNGKQLETKAPVGILGEHTRQVLSQLDYTETDIQTLFEQGAAADATAH